MSKIPSRTVTVSFDPTIVDRSKLRDGAKIAVDDDPTPPYQLAIGQIVTQHEADTEAGLTDAQAAEHLQRCGPNELQDGEGMSWVRVLVSQIGMVVCCLRGIALTDILI